MGGHLGDLVVSVTDQPPAPVPPLAATDSLRSPQFILAAMLIVLAAGVVVAVFAWGDGAVQNIVAGIVIGGALQPVTGFYYGSSQGSQKKDAILAAQVTPPPGGTTSTTTTASSVITPSVSPVVSQGETRGSI